MRARIPALFIVAGLLSACSLADSDPDETSVPFASESAEARGVLALVNDETTTFELLDVGIGLDRRAAAGIVEDRPFDSIAELDAVRWVGRSALGKLADYAVDNGWVPDGNAILGTFDGVPFTFDEATATLELANTATESVLRNDVGLDRRAVASILEARTIDTMSELASLYYVGSAMLQRLKSFAAPIDVGIISDIDRTVIPPHNDELPDAAYPGVATMYTALEGDRTGDVYYVTARPVWMIDGIPEWFVAHGVPTGPIATGISPQASIARAEKVSDITEVFEATPGQQFVMFGDTNHVDADAFRDIMALYPDRVIAAFVHDVKTIDAERLEGLIVFDDYDEVAEALGALGLLADSDVAAVVAEVRAP
jgi:hypothetical protein